MRSYRAALLPKSPKGKELKTLRAVAREAATDPKRTVLENQFTPDESPLTLALRLSRTNYDIGVLFQVSSKRLGRLQESTQKFLSPLVLNLRSRS